MGDCQVLFNRAIPEANDDLNLADDGAYGDGAG